MSNKSERFLPPCSTIGYLFVFLALLLSANTSKADDLSLAVNLGLSPKQAAMRYQPLIRYLSQVTGQQVQLKAYASSLAHWEKMRHDGYDLVLDNPAFTAYRAAKMDYTVIAKLPDVISFTLVTNVDEMVFEPDELIGRRVASQPSPSITALRLDEIYSNPMRQPNMMNVPTHAEALELVVKGRAAAAMVPTGMIAGYDNLNPIYTTAQIPAPGFSASAKLAPEMREKIRQALLDAPNSEAGRAMLEALNVPSFEPASNAAYSGLEKMLAGLYGY